MKYAIEMGSGAMVYVPSSGIQKLMGIHRQRGDVISLYFQNKESMLKIVFEF
jgi:hypothetical protein